MTGLGIDIGGTSVKLAAVADGRVAWTARGRAYRRPSADEVAGAIAEALAGRGGDHDSVGVCVPGLMDDDRRTVRQSVNLPGLNGVRLDDLVARALGRPVRVFAVLSDANATALDLYAGRGLSGRLFVLAIGAGVGAAVVDDGRPLSVDGDSPGHFGQMDVSLDGEPIVGPDGGAGSLEGYLSAAALARRYKDWASELKATDAPVRALVRAIRIGHAMYRPHHVALAGGIGNRLGRLLPEVRAAVEDRLTAIARPGWTLINGDSDFHAAQGAARAAAL